jgi:hypothetical protein
LSILSKSDMIHVLSLPFFTFPLCRR